MDLQQIQELPAFRQLATERTRFGAGMSIGMAAAYFGYILTSRSGRDCSDFRCGTERSSPGDF
jgi:hypothetical protein